MAGLSRTLPADDVRAHLRCQIERPGVTLVQCAESTGLTIHVVRDLAQGHSKKVSPVNANKILKWYGIGWCEHCGTGVRAYGSGRWCLECLNDQRQQRAA
jgi:hypothetical protein